ncbi:MAG: hypothetical protein M1136_04230 [Chloroflexi bacterium]|nr:hypothetical protein [Chloroflexota bacterium]MCL5074847.1 hypothetical protein [Chloroflexota bacterium]
MLPFDFSGFGLLVLDDLSRFIAGLCIVMPLLLLWSCLGSPGVIDYLILVILFIVSAIITVTATNLLLFYFFWEATAVVCWGIGRLGSRGSAAALGPAPVQGAGALASLCMFLALLLLAVENRSLSMSGLRIIDAGLVSVLLLAAIFLKSVGLLANAWHLGEGKIFSISNALLATAGVAALSLYPYLRFFLDLFREQTGWREMVLWGAMGVALATALAAVAESDINKVVSYAAFSQFYLIVLGFTIVPREQFGGLMLTLLTYALGLSGLFISIALVQSVAEARHLRSLGGLLPYMPFTATFFFLFALSVIGIPPLGGFFSRLLFSLGLLGQQRLDVALIYVLIVVLTMAYLMRLFRGIFLGEVQQVVVGEGHWPLFLSATLILLLLLIIGAMPDRVLEWLQPVVRYLS